MKKTLFLCISAFFILTACTSTSSETTNNSESTTKAYTMAEISSHSSVSDCWLLINGKVYDVTAYISTHPGGDEIARGCGQDATILFNTQGGEGSHSSIAKRQMDSFYIGDLAN